MGHTKKHFLQSPGSIFCLPTPTYYNGLLFHPARILGHGQGCASPHELQTPSEPLAVAVPPSPLKPSGAFRAELSSHPAPPDHQSTPKLFPSKDFCALSPCFPPGIPASPTCVRRLRGGSGLRSGSRPGAGMARGGPGAGDTRDSPTSGVFPFSSSAIPHGGC